MFVFYLTLNFLASPSNTSRSPVISRISSTGRVPSILGLRDARDKCMTFEQCAPHGRKIVSITHQLGAEMCQIMCSLFGHRMMSLQQTGPGALI